MMNFFKGKTDDKILQIICNMLKIWEFVNTFNNLDYNDDIHAKILSCLKKSKNYLIYDDIMSNYITYYFVAKYKENPIYYFKNTSYINYPALYYYENDILSYYFFFQAYRKKIISKNIESNDCISFLRKLGISNKILYSHMFNRANPEIFKYGFFTLDSISNLNERELTKFKMSLPSNFISIFLNQNCEIFSDFMKNGNTEHISLMDKNNLLPRILIEHVLSRVNMIYDCSKAFYPFVKEAKNNVIIYYLFKFIFYEENKQRIMALLSSYSFLLSEQYNFLIDSDHYSETFNSIEYEVKKIITDKKLKKNDSQQNILIVKKLLDLYQLTYHNIEELYLYDFNKLLLNIIEIDYPMKIVNKALELAEISKYKPEDNKSLKILLDYILKITLLCNTNIIGGSYIYNSNFIPKIIKLIKHLNFNDYSNFIFEIIIILKICFNRKIIDIAFLSNKNGNEDMTVKEYLFDILFINEPIIINESMYNFNIFDTLLNRINTVYSFIFEKTNIKILPDSFINMNLDDSYLNILKKISINMNDEFNQINWKSENNIQISPIQEDRKTIEDNENKFEKKIKEEIIKIKTKIPGFILLDFLRCLENLNQTNFYLNYDKNSFLIDDKFDLTSIIINDNLPLAVKSLLLNYLLKLVLSLKIDPNTNKVYGPLIYTSTYEKSPNGRKSKGKYLITLKSNESEKHLNETAKLINILIISIEIIKKKKKSLNFEKAYIERNGLYDYCVSIIQGIYYLSNLIVNTNKIHELYLSCFSKLVFKFYENENIFMKIININMEQSKIIFNFNGEFDYKKSLLIAEEINRQIEKYINKINDDSYNFCDRKLTSIYQSFIDYNKGKLCLEKSNHYSFILNKKDNEKITLEELNEFNGIDSNTNSIILNNYNKWNKYINNESNKIKDLFEKILNSKKDIMNKREIFYMYIFLYLSNLGVAADRELNDHLFFKTLISIIISDENFKIIFKDENMKRYTKEHFRGYKDLDFDDVKARIIGHIIKKIYSLTIYELLISHCFSNTKQENQLSEVLNCLILFLEILGEHLNEFFHDSIFKYKFDLSKENDNNPVAKYDEESQTFKMLKEGIEEKNIYSPYEVLLELHQKIVESLIITNDDYYRQTQQNNLLIVLNSLTYCIIEYSNFENPVYKSIMEKLYFEYFNSYKKDKSLNPIFQSINFEIDANMLKKEKHIFIINNILSLFIIYIKNGKKELFKNYFYEVHLHYQSYDPYLYLFHIFIYTLQVINDLDKNLLIKQNNVEKIIDLYKKGRFKDYQIFTIAQKYYEIIFLIKKYYGYKELKPILPDYKEKDINSKKILDIIGDSEFNLNFINDIIINEDSIDGFKKSANIMDYSESMDSIFSLWKEIFYDIEIFIEGKSHNIYYIIRPENLYLSNYEKIFYDDIIDYRTRDSKLMGLYQNLDSFLFEMISNYCNGRFDRFNLAKVFNYFGLELINILLFILHNIILLIHYYKSWKEEYSKYNEIENNKTSKILLILSGIHIVYILLVIINWFINRLNIDYFHILSEYSIKNVELKTKLSDKKKVDKFKKLLNNYSSSFIIINEFFPELIKLKKIYILIVYTIMLNPKVFPFIISLICLILYYFLSEIFLIAPLLLIANLIPTLAAIFKGLVTKLKYLIYIYTYTLIVLYIFSWIGFLFLPNLFKFEVVNKYNENIVDQNQEIVEEYMCSSSIQCILYFLNFGLSSGGSLDLNLISFKNNYGYYLRQFFFDIFFFLFINMIFSNIFLALITDAFNEMRDYTWKKEEEKNEVCFICDLNISDCINQNIEFNLHIKEHSKWKYINFICKMILEEEAEFNREEYYIRNLIKKKSIDWFPKK